MIVIYECTHTQQTNKHTQQATLQAEKAEQELQQKIQRENAELIKAANQREEAMRSLTTHRARTKEERKMLTAVRRVRTWVWLQPCMVLEGYMVTNATKGQGVLT